MSSTIISLNQKKKMIHRLITKNDFKDGFIIVTKRKKVFLKVMID